LANLTYDLHMATDIPESALYEPVRKWLESDTGLRCQHSWKNSGPQEARPDVTGLRHAGGQICGDFELIAIEVKTSSDRFVTSAGQTGAYGIYADRTYLCCYQDDEPFDEEQIEIASHLGIGLINIDKDLKVSRVLAAPVRQPIPRKRLELLDHLGFGVCQLCESPFPTSDEKEKPRSWKGLLKGDKSAISEAVIEGKGYVWYLWNWSKSFKRLEADDGTFDRRYLCRDCVEGLFWDLGPPEGDED